jgi:hypothetical protein
VEMREGVEGDPLFPTQIGVQDFKEVAPEGFRSAPAAASTAQLKGVSLPEKNSHFRIP